MLRHVVMFKLRDRQDAEELARRLRQLEGGIECLKRIEAGVNALDDARAWDVVLLADFDSAEQLERYRVHPLHQKVLAYIKSVVDRVATVDYEDVL